MAHWLKTAGLALLVSACTSAPDPDRFQTQPQKDDCSPHLGNPYIQNCQTWAMTHEGQRQADLGDGTYLNPILSGNRPDPSILKDGDGYYHMITAVGGTAGPPTGHMVIHARSKSIHGPWEDSPQIRLCAPKARRKSGGRAVTPPWWKAPRTGTGT